jgi:hypothetical protein
MGMSLFVEYTWILWSNVRRQSVKYVIHSPGDQSGFQIITPTLSTGIMHV